MGNSLLKTAKIASEIILILVGIYDSPSCEDLVQKFPDESEGECDWKSE
jgi:hypothetical protein